MRNRLWLPYLLFCCLAANLQAQDIDTARMEFDLEPNLPPVQIDTYDLQYENDELIFSVAEAEGQASVSLSGEPVELIFSGGQARVAAPSDRKGRLVLVQTGRHHHLYHLSVDKYGQNRLRSIPLWLSIVPPLIAILLALIFREVIISLFIGVWSGAFIAGGMRLESIGYYLTSLWSVVEKYVVTALTDSGHMSVIIFSLLIGGMVAVISRNGGMAGIVKGLSRYARSDRSSQFVTWFLGVAIFFDDYANTLIVGNTMRPVTDKFKISREKLAYIVDSTAAPVAAVAFITTWIGAELGYIGDGIAELDGFSGGTPYSIFLDSLKYSFYPVLTLSFILLVIYLRRDFGPMYHAEKRARTTGQVSRRVGSLEGEATIEDLEPVKGAPLRWYNAFIPVALVILMTIFGLLVTGFESTYHSLQDMGMQVSSMRWGDVWSAMPGSSGFVKLGTLIGNSDSYVALLWASTSGVIAAILLTLGSRIMPLADTMNTLVTGFKTMLPALIILTLAWSLALTTDELHTAEYLSNSLKNALSPYWLPVIIFVMAAFISFSTGSSWSTMAILYPIAIPTTWVICQEQGIDPDHSMELLLNVIAVTLAASVLGDHCSPISDTTILSSLASDCNHIDHVRTQLPYALLVGTFSAVCGGLATMMGGGWLISTALALVSIGLMALFLLRFGKRIDF